MTRAVFHQAGRRDASRIDPDVWTRPHRTARVGGGAQRAVA